MSDDNADPGPDRETLLGAGKRLAATAAGRAFKEGSPKVKAEDLLVDPGVERQGRQAGKLDRASTPDQAGGGRTT